MRIASLIVLLALSCAAAAQTVWKYVDDKGVTHYTDQFVPGAEKVQLRSGSATTAQTSTSATSSIPTRKQQTDYRTFQITRPANQDSVINTGGVLQVSMQLEPALLTGHSLSLYLDGKRVEGYPSDALDYELQNVPRGEHTLVGVVIDENSRRAAETSKVTFTMRQQSILMKPPVGPSVRPAPKAPTPPRPAVRSSQPAFADLNPARPKPADTSTGPSL
jgi:hypothetical protein